MDRVRVGQDAILVAVDLNGLCDFARSAIGILIGGSKSVADTSDEGLEESEAVLEVTIHLKNPGKNRCMYIYRVWLSPILRASFFVTIFRFSQAHPRNILLVSTNFTSTYTHHLSCALCLEHWTHPLRRLAETELFPHSTLIAGDVICELLDAFAVDLLVGMHERRSFAHLLLHTSTLSVRPLSVCAIASSFVCVSSISGIDERQERMPSGGIVHPLMRAVSVHLQLGKRLDRQRVIPLRLLQVDPNGVGFLASSVVCSLASLQLRVIRTIGHAELRGICSTCGGRLIGKS